MKQKKSKILQMPHTFSRSQLKLFIEFLGEENIKIFCPDINLDKVTDQQAYTLMMVVLRKSFLVIDKNEKEEAGSLERTYPSN